MSRMMICKDWNKCKKRCLQKKPFKIGHSFGSGCGKTTELVFLPKDVQLRIVLKSLL